MSKLQPLLVPCKGCMADLTVCEDDAFPDSLAVYWGTAVLQRLPRDNDSFVFKLLGGWLFNLKFRISELEKCFGVSAKTLRRWGSALVSGDMEQLRRAFAGRGAAALLSADQEQYVRVRYKELKDTCRDYRSKIIEDLKRIWGVSPSGECLRQLFRQEDELEDTVAFDEGMREKTKGSDDSSLLVNGVAGDGSPLADRSTSDCSQVARKSSTRGECCRGFEPMSADVSTVSLRAPEAKESLVSEDLSRMKSTPEYLSCADENIGDRSDSMEKKRENGCASSPSTPPGSRNHSPFSADGLPPVGPSSPAWGPLLSSPSPQPLQFSHHAGRFILAPWLAETFGGLPALIRQFAAQTLLGSVNFEQSKLVHYKSLSQIIGEIIRTPDTRAFNAVWPPKPMPTKRFGKPTPVCYAWIVIGSFILILTPRSIPDNFRS